ncbi:DUF1643 domain-containing protein [Paenibacillus azoreducens]|uniref:DUF1643 domain-containing protein n=1 Tax=Paenibacillus azoreducens TaxID=116718 RepID=A0A920CUH9_9BACL|nr:DUF1643 domain-containing protein [Paenibacillus azoreducens]GIO49453.1 hypothetical protein J34TS1_42180 [Paenibacillus azoreducens]
MKLEAVFDESGSYRYLLSRVWNPTLPKLLYVMLNPSTADKTTEDQTSRQCIYFAKKFGFGSFEVVNLYSLISTNPKGLRTSSIDPIGNDNDLYITEAAARADLIIVAWGTDHFFNKRNEIIRNKLKADGYKLFCLKKTKYGHPGHPSRLKHDIDQLIEF